MLAALIRSLSFPGSGSVVSAPTTERSKQHGTVGDSETSVVQRPHRPQHSSRGSESNNSDVALEHWADPTRARGSHDAVHASAGQAGPDRRRALAPGARAVVRGRHSVRRCATGGWRISVCETQEW